MKNFKILLLIFYMFCVLVIIADILPVTLTYFIGTKFGNSVLLEWETATEQDNLGFNLQRKDAGGLWLNLAFVEGHGNSNVPHQYYFLDSTAADAVQNNFIYYRLEQLDIDGGVDYPDSIEVDFPTTVQTEIFPSEFVLHQNYPNPFNPSTKIKFSIPAGSVYSKYVTVSLRVFDLLGSEIAVLLNKQISPGNYEVEFNAENLPSGIYFYKLNLNNFSQTKKMVLLR
ncbi:MAG: T9SS type A sorting domain-containing protein [Melioribacteraceae bacterium]|nr:T9SS type A sorting domain-containing protein [Melioribacteraceae bacterium]